MSDEATIAATVLWACGQVAIVVAAGWIERKLGR